jgi:hypothetical protein
VNAIRRKEEEENRFIGNRQLGNTEEKNYQIQEKRITKRQQKS